jgi:hypothetical protein
MFATSASIERDRQQRISLYRGMFRERRLETLDRDYSCSSSDPLGAPDEIAYTASGSD